jgi:hypothetical protein
LKEGIEAEIKGGGMPGVGGFDVLRPEPEPDDGEVIEETPADRANDHGHSDPYLHAGEIMAEHSAVTRGPFRFFLGS